MSGNLFAAQDLATTTAPAPTIVAPGALTERERAEADRSYAYQFRYKDRLLSPYVTGAGGAPAAAGAAMQPLTEDEKLYRYFGVASSLYEEGKYEEAIEILKFIVEKDPKNSYVKKYLQKVIDADRAQERRYKAQAQQDAQALKKQKQYDAALAKFSDVLDLDPGNMQAQHYVKLLKSYYSKEARIERIVSAYEPKISPDAARELMEAGERKIMPSAPPFTGEAGSVDFSEKNEALLDDAELGLTIDGIIDQYKDEEFKSNTILLSEGDIIQVLVYGHNELSGQVLVGGDGIALLPLVNAAVNLKGLTIEEATDRIREEEAKYVKDPIVAVSLVSTTKLFYFIDEVGCTPYPIPRPNFTLRDALFMSDWGNNRALGRVIIIKPDRLHPVVKKVDAFDLIYRGNLANNVKINDGDVIYVPMTIAAKTTQTVNDTLAPFQALQAARNLWLQSKWTQKGLKSMFRIPPDSQTLPATVGGGT